MHVEIKLNEIDLKKLVLDYIREKLGPIQLEDNDVKIEVKSKQNYRSEWEEASFRAVVSKHELEK